MPSIAAPSSDKVIALEKRLAALYQEISSACAKSSRSIDSVSLVLVSKGQDFSLIEAAYRLGQRDFGESYAREMDTKMDQAERAGLGDIVWHYIGAIQSNKIKTIVRASYVHSVDSMPHAALLDKWSHRPLKIFLQLNLDGDPHRRGFVASEVMNAIESMAGFKHLYVIGLMAIAPLSSSLAPDHWFKKVAELKKQILAAGLLDDVKLSMGMSADFISAIECGSNLLRVGEKVFGPRALNRNNWKI